MHVGVPRLFKLKKMTGRENFWYFTENMIVLAGFSLWISGKFCTEFKHREKQHYDLIEIEEGKPEYFNLCTFKQRIRGNDQFSKVERFKNSYFSYGRNSGIRITNIESGETSDNKVCIGEHGMKPFDFGTIWNDRVLLMVSSEEAIDFFEVPVFVENLSS